MFVKQRRNHERHGRVINQPEFCGKGEAEECEKHQEVKPLREAQASRDPELDDERMDPFAPIEIVILGRVNQVETGNPKEDACAQNKRRKVDIPGLRNPGANRRNSEGEAKEKMRHRGKSFG